MEQMFLLLEKHIGQRGCFHLKGPQSSTVGGKLTSAFPEYVQLDQDTDIAYIPLENVLYVTFPRRTG